MNINFDPADTFRGTRIYRQANNLAYAYETNHTAVDADGAPNAYHPNDIGLDALANAGYPHTNWWKDVLVPNPAHPSQAFVQPSGHFAGYFVSMTSLRAPNGDHLDPSTYVDATRFPYVVIPTGFGSLPHVAKPGDVGTATHVGSGMTTTFIVGDSGGGSAAKLGEGSIALFVALGGHNPNPRTGSGVPSGKIQYIIFPGSRKPGTGLWPRTNQDIHDQVMQLISNTPGIAALPEPPAGYALIAAPSPMVSTGTVYTANTRESTLRLRNSPSISSPANANVIGELPDGHPVRVLTTKKVKGFREVETSLNGAHFRGFASAQYLREARDETDVPVFAPTASLPTSGIVAVYMPRRPGTVTKRSAPAGAHSLNEPGQPERMGSSPDELRSELANIIDWLAVDNRSYKRYQPHDGLTFCNIYAHDYCYLAGV